jgi:hypothetical protein
VLADEVAGGGDPGRGLRGQLEGELGDEQLLVGVELCVAGEDEGSTVGRGEVDVEHLDGCELVEHGAGREAAGKGPQPGAQRDVQAVGHEGDEDVRLDAVLKLMEDGPQLQIVLEVLEGGLDLDQLDIELPQLGRRTAVQVAAQQVAAFALACLAQLGAVERVGE